LRHLKTIIEQELAACAAMMQSVVKHFSRERFTLLAQRHYPKQVFKAASGNRPSFYDALFVK
jgi:hypothetical protein